MLSIILTNLLLLLAIVAVIILIIKLTKTEHKAPIKQGEDAPKDAPKHPIKAVPRSLIVAWICDGVITAVLLGFGIFLIITDLADRDEWLDGLTAALGAGLSVATLVANIPTVISIFMRRARVLIRMVLALVLPVLIIITVFYWFFL